MTITHAPFDACPDCHAQERDYLYPWIRQGVWCLNLYHVGEFACLCGRVFRSKFQRWLHTVFAGPLR